MLSNEAALRGLARSAEKQLLRLEILIRTLQLHRSVSI